MIKCEISLLLIGALLVQTMIVDVDCTTGLGSLRSRLGFGRNRHHSPSASASANAASNGRRGGLSSAQAHASANSRVGGNNGLYGAGRHGNRYGNRYGGYNGANTNAAAAATASARSNSYGARPIYARQPSYYPPVEPVYGNDISGYNANDLYRKSTASSRDVDSGFNHDQYDASNVDSDKSSQEKMRVRHSKNKSKFRQTPFEVIDDHKNEDYDMEWENKDKDRYSSSNVNSLSQSDFNREHDDFSEDIEQQNSVDQYGAGFGARPFGGHRGHRGFRAPHAVGANARARAQVLGAPIAGMSPNLESSAADASASAETYTNSGSGTRANHVLGPRRSRFNRAPKTNLAYSNSDASRESESDNYFTERSNENSGKNVYPRRHHSGFGEKYRDSELDGHRAYAYPDRRRRHHNHHDRYPDTTAEYEIERQREIERERELELEYELEREREANRLNSFGSSNPYVDDYGSTATASASASASASATANAYADAAAAAAANAASSSNANKADFFESRNSDDHTVSSSSSSSENRPLLERDGYYGGHHHHHHHHGLGESAVANSNNDYESHKSDSSVKSSDVSSDNEDAFGASSHSDKKYESFDNKKDVISSDNASSVVRPDGSRSANSEKVYESKKSDNSVKSSSTSSSSVVNPPLPPFVPSNPYMA